MTFLSKLLAGIAVTSSTIGIGILKALDGSIAIEESDALKTKEIKEEAVVEKEFAEDEVTSSSQELSGSLSLSEEDVPAKEKTVIQAFKLVPAKKRCKVFLIQQESKGTAKFFDGWEERKEEDRKGNKNKGFWDKVEKGCNKEAQGSEAISVYVSNPKGSGLTYLDRYQQRTWTIIQ